MITTRTRHFHINAAALALGLCLVGAPAFAADTPDAWITMKTKIALMTTDNVSAADLNVDTVSGVVTLHGKVAREGERNKAERADADVKNAVQAAFKANARVKDSGISVASVNGGVVLLAGKTTSLESHLEAVQVADAVKGVRRVATEVHVDAGT